jgi:hypothetical protein
MSFHHSLCLFHRSAPKGCIVTIYLHSQIQVSCARGWITPDFDSAIGTCGDHLSSLRGVMLCPCYDFMVYLRRRIRFKRSCLRQEELRKMSPMCIKAREQLTSRRSQAQMAPFSSPAMTLASPCPKQARQRYEEWTWPVKSLSSFPAIASMRRMCPSSVITRYVDSSWVGTTDVTGSANK